MKDTRPAARAARTQPDGLRIVWAPVNQAWFVMWNGSLLRIFNDRDEALAYVEDLRRGSLSDDDAWETAEDLERR